MKTTTSLFLASMLAACGSDGIAGGDDLGTGTGTLVVAAEVRARNLIANADDPNDFATELEVRVERAGQPVSGAMVLVTSDAGEVVLVEGGESGRYAGAQNGYAERFVLDVIAGDDELTGARVDGPALHVITGPAPGAQVPGGVAVEVTWDADDAAESTSIDTHAMDQVAIEDTGAFTIPADGLDHDDGKAKDERIRVRRENRISPTGGAGGSSFGVEVRQEIEIVVLP